MQAPTLHAHSAMRYVPIIPCCMLLHQVGCCACCSDADKPQSGILLITGCYSASWNACIPPVQLKFHALCSCMLPVHPDQIAATTTPQKVVFETVHEEVSPSFQELYDTAAALWQDTRALLKSNEAPKEVMRALYGAQLRFFRQLVTAAKVGESTSVLG